MNEEMTGSEAQGTTIDHKDGDKKGVSSVSAVLDGLSNFLNTFERILQGKNEPLHKNVTLFMATIRSFIDRFRKPEINAGAGLLGTRSSESGENENERLVEKVRGAIIKLTESFEIINEDNPTLSLLCKNVKFIVGENNKKTEFKLLPQPASIDEDNEDCDDGKVEEEEEGHVCKQQATFSNNVLTNNSSNDEEENQPQPFQVKRLAEKSPLQNDLILKEIFRYLPYNDLFQLRLVCHQWNDIILAISRKSFTLQVEFSWDTTKNCYMSINSEKESDNTLSDFTECLHDSPKFPIACINFLNGDLNSEDAMAFFSDHGMALERLRVNIRNRSEEDDEPITPALPVTSTQTLRKILLHYATNIIDLTIISTPEEWREETSNAELFPEPRGTIILPKITYLDFGPHISNNQVVKDILEATVNLKSILNFQIQFWDLEASEKTKRRVISTIEDLYFRPTKDDLSLYQDFAKFNPQLTGLTFCMSEVVKDNSREMWHTVAELTESFLTSSKGTLLKIDGFSPLGFLPRFKIPILEKLQEFEFLDWKSPEERPRRSSNYGIFPSGARDITHLFPCLQYLTIDGFSPRGSNDWKTYFNCNEPLQSVKSMIIAVNSPKALTNIAAMCPAVDALTLVVKIGPLFLPMMRVLWTSFPELRDLDIQLENFRAADISRSLLDSAITGIHKDLCKRLRRNSRNVPVADAEKLRQFPSILDAKKLSNLTIVLQPDENEYYSNEIFSHVAGIYGFEPMKKLNQLFVTISTPGEAVMGDALNMIENYVDCIN